MLDQVMSSQVGIGGYGLQAGGSVDAAQGGDLGAVLWAELEHLHHEGHVVVGLKPVAANSRRIAGAKGRKARHFCPAETA